MSKTPYFTKERVERPWYVVDAADRVLGRLATGVAKLLIGKYRPEYTPGQDCGAFVVVVNAGRIAVTGKKKLQKKYYRHSGYPGGLRELTFNQQMERKPTEALRLAIKGMLPKNKLGARLITKLKMYAGEKHPHQAQMPEPISAEQLQKM